MESASASAGKVVSTHQSCGGRVAYSDGMGGSLGTNYDNGFGHMSLKTQVCKRIVTVRGYRTQRYNTRVFKQLDYLMSRFVTTGPASLAWEFVPYSFVVDWFIDLRAITDKLDNLLTGNSKDIIDICISDKIECKSDMSLRSNGNYVIGNAGQLLSSSQLKYYSRNPVNSYNKVGFAGRFGKNQAALLGALVHQKVANLV
jgi:hypothetical protein